MATLLATRLTNLQNEVSGQLKLIHRQMEQIEKQQAVLDVQFRRIADIQAELDQGRPPSDGLRRPSLPCSSIRNSIIRLARLRRLLPRL